jgi:uncharacterized OB-fold protein
MKATGLTAYKCRACGKVHYPFHDRCLNCHGREFEEVDPQGCARLLTYTQIFNLPWGFDERFLVIGIAEFENGVRAMGQVKIAGESLDELHTGMLMSPSWEPVRVQYGEKVFGLKFTPLPD